MKIFIIESPNPNDLLDSRNERASLESMCKMFGHQVASFFTYTKADFENIIEYVSKVELEDDELLCLHISSHGNSKGIAIGNDFIEWKEVSILLIPIFENEKIGKKTIVVLSSCGANNQKITNRINQLDENARRDYHFPNYFFVYNQEEVPWTDALLCWSILYHQFGKLGDVDKKAVQNILKDIDKFGSLKYFRWNEDELKYKSFTSRSR